MRALITLVCLPILALAAVPEPVRDTSYDWRCVGVSDHQRQDKAIVACQNAALANPGRSYIVEGGRYRVLVAAPVEPVEPDPVEPDPVEPAPVEPGEPTGHAYFDLLAAHPNAVLTKAFHSQQEIDDTYLVPSSGAHEAGLWTYDPAEDAARLNWAPNRASLPAGGQLRWGGTDGYREAVETSFGKVGTSTLLFVWEWKFSEHWAISRRDLSHPNVLKNHKAFQAARDNGGDISIEPRFRYTGSAAQFPGPVGNQVAHMDLRTYIGGGGASGDAVPQQATVYPEPGQWVRIWLFLDGENLEVSYWAQIQGQPVVEMIDRAGGFSTELRDIDGFWFELNTSQEGGSGISVESYMWGRNWVVLRGLSHAEAASLVSLAD